MIEWFVKLIRLPNWSAAGVLREKAGLLEYKNRELETEKAALTAEKAALKAQLEILQQENQQLKAELESLAHIELDEDQTLFWPYSVGFPSRPLMS